MSAVAEPLFVAETLVWCNERRVRRGKEPMASLPKGKRSDGKSCPCGKATGLFVGSTTWYDPADLSTRLPLPDGVKDFVRAFDDGKLPQYDEEAR